MKLNWNLMGGGGVGSTKQKNLCGGSTWIGYFLELHNETRHVNKDPSIRQLQRLLTIESNSKALQESS